MLEGPSVHAALTGGRVARILRDPLQRDSLVAVAGKRAFKRVGPGKWAAAGAAEEFRAWESPLPPGIFRLPTGELVHRAVKLSDGTVVGAVEAGLVESANGFRNYTEPAGLPVTMVAAAAANPAAPEELTVAGDPTGLFLCEGDAACTRELPGRFTAVAWFGDGSRLAGDDTGGVWRDTGDGWARQAVGGSAVTAINGVPDGGPRHVRTRDGDTFLSNDLGHTWRPGPLPPGRLGSGGMIATVRDNGALVITGLDGRIHQPLAGGTATAESTIRWASPDVIVVGLPDGGYAVERGSWTVRRLRYPDGEERPLLEAAIQGDKLLIYAGRETVERFETAAETPWSVSRIWDETLAGWPYLVGLGAILLGLLLWINHRLRRLADRRI